MSSQGKLNKIEAEIMHLEISEPDSPRLVILEAEADAIADILTASERAREAKVKADRLKQEAEAKVQRALEEKQRIEWAEIQSEVQGFKDNKQWDQMFLKYGHLYVDDYAVEGNKIYSNLLSWCKKTEEMIYGEWEVEDTDAKVKQLVNWRIYNYYCRNKTSAQDLLTED